MEVSIFLGGLADSSSAHHCVYWERENDDFVHDFECRNRPLERHRRLCGKTVEKGFDTQTETPLLHLTIHLLSL